MLHGVSGGNANGLLDRPGPQPGVLTPRPTPTDGSTFVGVRVECVLSPASEGRCGSWPSACERLARGQILHEPHEGARRDAGCALLASGGRPPAQKVAACPLDERSSRASASRSPRSRCAHSTPSRGELADEQRRRDTARWPAPRVLHVRVVGAFLLALVFVEQGRASPADDQELPQPSPIRWPSTLKAEHGVHQAPATCP